jgi:hypothetical protein
MCTYLHNHIYEYKNIDIFNSYFLYLYISGKYFSSRKNNMVNGDLYIYKCIYIYINVKINIKILLIFLISINISGKYFSNKKNSKAYEDLCIYMYMYIYEYINIYIIRYKQFLLIFLIFIRETFFK